MGARINYVFKAYEKEASHVTLYAHWGEMNWREELAWALGKARPRWDDPSYGIRIVVSQLIGPHWDKEIGFGLFTSTDGEDLGDFTVVVDFTNQTVNDTGNEHSFGSFVEYHQEIMENHVNV
jgi:hypothetical protein